MNPLSPEFRRLIRWAKTAPEPPPLTAPVGLPTRIATRWCDPATPDLAALWQRAVFASAWAAAAVILLGLALLNSQRSASNSPYDVTPAYQLVASELVP